VLKQVQGTELQVQPFVEGFMPGKESRSLTVCHRGKKGSRPRLEKKASSTWKEGKPCLSCTGAKGAMQKKDSNAVRGGDLD